MATITDPQAIAFVNQELRPACDAFIRALRTLRQLSLNYSGGALGPLFVGTTDLENSYVADGSTNPDGSKGDGRTPLLGYDVDNAINQLGALNTWIGTQSGMEAAIVKPSVNTTPVF